MKKFLQAIIWPNFTLIAGISSVTGLVVLFLNENWAIYVALSCIILSLVILLIALIHVLLKFIEKNNNKPFDKKSTFFKYSTLNGKDYSFEVYRLIQSKAPILTEVCLNYVSTGKINNYTSKLQDIEYIEPQHDGEWGKIILNLKKPLVFNQTGVFHYKIETMDNYEEIKPFINTRVNEDIDLIHYRIVLSHKPDDYEEEAKIYKRKFGTDVESKEKLWKKIPFDPKTRSYEFHLTEAIPGYEYIIRWER